MHVNSVTKDTLSGVLVVTDSDDDEVQDPTKIDRLVARLEDNFQDFKKEYKPLRKTVRLLAKAYGEDGSDNAAFIHN